MPAWRNAAARIDGYTSLPASNGGVGSPTPQARSSPTWKVATTSSTDSGRPSITSHGTTAQSSANRVSSTVSLNGVGCHSRKLATHSPMNTRVTYGRRLTGLSSHSGSTRLNVARGTLR